MKHIIYILLFISLGATAQIKVGVNFDKNNHADNSYNVKSDNVKGGWHSVATIIQRDSLLAQFSTTLQDGMAVFVRADSTGYIRNQVAGVWNKFTGYSKAKQDSLLALKLNKTDTASLSNRINNKQPLENQRLSTGNDVTFRYMQLGTNGNTGQGLKVGDDAVIYDVDTINTIGIRGVQAYYAGYIKFGTNGNIFGSDGSVLKYGADTVATQAYTRAHGGVSGITTLTGDVTASGTGSVAATIANGVVGVAKLSATGTPSGTTYLRGDNTWATVSAGANFAYSEIPSGSINGTNTTFTASHTPLTGTYQVFRNGLMQISGADYTRSGTSITWLYPPTTGDSLLENYQY